MLLIKLLADIVNLVYYTCNVAAQYWGYTTHIFLTSTSQVAAPRACGIHII